MFESKSGVFLIAGLGFFLLAFLSNALVPWLMYKDMGEKTAEQMVTRNVLLHFRDLAQRYPKAFEEHLGKLDKEDTDHNRDLCAKALRLGRRTYIAEGCWHCHSQFVRPVSNESRRWGPVSKSEEYQNELQRPVMFGTRRVGPDLIRESGRRSNDWHIAHFFRPKMTSPESVMPDYTWFLDNNRPDGPGTPNARGLAIVTYMQWLGSWIEEDPTKSPEFFDRGGPR
jgi:cbb3-type cytochrome oxidase cytochrome c subunit